MYTNVDRRAGAFWHPSIQAYKERTFVDIDQGRDDTELGDPDGSRSIIAKAAQDVCALAFAIIYAVGVMEVSAIGSYILQRGLLDSCCRLCVLTFAPRLISGETARSRNLPE